MATAKKTETAPADTGAETAAPVEGGPIAQPANPNPAYLVEGHDGVVRIGGIAPDGWVPAPVEVSEEEAAAAEAAAARFEEQVAYGKLSPEERSETPAPGASEAPAAAAPPAEQG